MERKEFLKTTCSICIAFAAGLTLDSFFSCSGEIIYKTTVTNNDVVVPSSLFIEKSVQVIRPKNFGYDIALRKEQDGSFLALLMRCTHADNPLVSTGTGFQCNLHGSRFDNEGKVTKGPAEKPLKKLSTEVNADNIIIHLS